MLCKAPIEVDWIDSVQVNVEGSKFPQMAAVVRLSSTPQQVCLGNVHLRPPLAMGNSGSLVQHARAYLFEAGEVHKKELQAVISECANHTMHTDAPVLVVGDFNEGSLGSGVK